MLLRELKTVRGTLLELDDGGFSSGINQLASTVSQGIVKGPESAKTAGAAKTDLALAEVSTTNFALLPKLAALKSTDKLTQVIFETYPLNRTQLDQSARNNLVESAEDAAKFFNMFPRIIGAMLDALRIDANQRLAGLQLDSALGSSVDTFVDKRIAEVIRTFNQRDAGAADQRLGAHAALTNDKAKIEKVREAFVNGGNSLETFTKGFIDLIVAEAKNKQRAANLLRAAFSLLRGLLENQYHLHLLLESSLRKE